MNAGQGLRLPSAATRPVSRGVFVLAALIALGVALSALPLTVAAALVLGAIALLVIAVQPLVGLALIIFAIPFGSPFNIQIGGAASSGQGFNLGPTEALFALTMTAWLARMVARREARIVKPWIVWPLLGFIGAQLLSLTVTHSLPASGKEIVKWVEVVLMVVFVATEVNRRDLGAGSAGGV